MNNKNVLYEGHAPIEAGDATHVGILASSPASSDAVSVEGWERKMNTKHLLYEAKTPKAGVGAHVSKDVASTAKAVADVFSYVVLPVGRYSCGDLEGLVDTKPWEDGLPDHSSNTELGGE